MTRMLASVNSLAEAKLVYQAGADIIDLKQPEAGALGALPLETIAQIRAWCAGRTPISATVGDLPMQPALIGDAVLAMAATRVDYIKIGFFPGGDWLGVVQKLAELTQKQYPLIAVLFADTQPDPTFVETLQQAGFAGVMLDTMDKNRGSLTHAIPLNVIERFVDTAKSHNLLCGLAGSLRLTDIPALLRFQPDYLGFRGALCIQHKRTANLDGEAVKHIKKAIQTGMTLETG
ncbi:(5-formylfuran-3-yl)methyl phosphate synthase [Methylomicrobium sp. Wu6]|uniref:(5-formylfuran-3-yl)methyl phosphate synthase n=1 Tax=Methylomicrobium sp. Wu6 TaxID=3107928 RepID=UPI002DD64738|nr:(5-formylfuran-3-yl)methyl phosphate synthase [Methylomicrobium sp. Wu6]MEC4748708.1 (5-formylfuran-3-yl)methyl phosphate synthase [Methylomicrobium sp. Wu6]